MRKIRDAFPKGHRVTLFDYAVAVAGVAAVEQIWDAIWDLCTRKCTVWWWFRLKMSLPLTHSPLTDSPSVTMGFVQIISDARLLWWGRACLECTTKFKLQPVQLHWTGCSRNRRICEKRGDIKLVQYGREKKVEMSYKGCVCVCGGGGGSPGLAPGWSDWGGC